MANMIALFKKYITLLDEVYKQSSKTAILDGDSKLVQAGANTNEIIVPKLSMDGLADYSRNSGYVKGDVELKMETVKFNYDRGRKFTVDAMDNEETSVSIDFTNLGDEDLCARVVKSLDKKQFKNRTLKTHLGVFLTVFWYNRKII